MLSVATPQRIHVDTYEHGHIYDCIHTHTHTHLHIHRALLRRSAARNNAKRCVVARRFCRTGYPGTCIYCPSCAAVGGIHCDSPVTLFHLHTAAPEESVLYPSAVEAVHGAVDRSTLHTVAHRPGGVSGVPLWCMHKLIAIFLKRCKCVHECAERRKRERESARARARERESEKERKGGVGWRERKFYVRYSITLRTKRAEAGAHNKNHKRSKRACNEETGPRVQACA